MRKSVVAGHLVCLVCGKRFKTLKRHLGSEHGLTPEAYSERYRLPRSYPIVAPDYAKVRSSLAKQIRLGRDRQSLAQARMGGRKWRS